MTASVVIPTRNRAAQLRATLGSVIAEAEGAGAEVVVVDNGSTDGTPALLAEFAAASPGRVRTIVEPEPGAARARNAGVRVARGTVVAFCDDDVRPRLGWLRALLARFADPRVACVGGRVFLLFDPAGRPPWLTGRLTDYLSAYDLGPRPIDLGTRSRGDSPRGASMAVRRAAFLDVGGFSPRLGPRSTRPSVGEESELCVRLLEGAHTVWYEPTAEVDHVVDAARLDPTWFLARAFWTGWAEGSTDARHRRLWNIAGRLRWHYGSHALRFPRSLRRAFDGEQLMRECQRREAWGYTTALLRELPRRERRLPIAEAR